MVVTHIYFTVLVLLLSVLLLTSAQNDPHYEISVSRSQLILPNIITMTCNNFPPGINAASFFLNGSIVTFGSASNTVLSINIEPSLEGDYTCGVGEDQGSPVRLVAYPGVVIITPQTFYGGIGLTVRLDCLTTPGRLVDLYYVTWQNAADTSIQYFRLLPPDLRTEESSEIRLSDRYSIDYTNFSLFISDVQPEDANSEFLCVVGLTDPRNPSNTYVYSQSSTTKITLNTFWVPRFVTEPAPRTISLSAVTNTTFSCTVTSGPLPPKVAWWHKGDMVSDYLIDYFAVPQQPQGGERYPPPPTTLEIFYDGEIDMILYKITSLLIVNDLSASDDGTVVECGTAYFNGPEVDSVLVYADSRSALLTVLTPEVIVEPNLVTVGDAPGTSATFNCSIATSSSYQYTVSWRHRDKDIPTQSSSKYQRVLSSSDEAREVVSVLVIHELNWAEDSGRVECVVDISTLDGELIDVIEVHASLEIIKLDLTQSDTGDYNLRCATALRDEEPETAIFEFFDALGDPRSPPAVVTTMGTLDMNSAEDVIVRCTVGDITSTAVAITRFPLSPIDDDIPFLTSNVYAAPGEVAALLCPFSFSRLQNTLPVFTVAWQRITETGSELGIETDPNNRRYDTGFSGVRRTPTLFVPVTVEDVTAPPLMFRCLLKLTRCNDTQNEICAVTSVAGPLTALVTENSTELENSNVTTPPAPPTPIETTPTTEENTPSATTSYNDSTTTTTEDTSTTIPATTTSNNSNNNNNNNNTAVGYRTALIVTTPLFSLAILTTLGFVIISRLIANCQNRGRKNNPLHICPQAAIIPYPNLHDRFDEDDASSKDYESIQLNHNPSHMPGVEEVHVRDGEPAAYESINVDAAGNHLGADVRPVNEEVGHSGVGGRGYERLHVPVGQGRSASNPRDRDGPGNYDKLCPDNYDKLQPYEVVSGYERVRYNATLEEMLLEGARQDEITRGASGRRVLTPLID